VEEIPTKNVDEGVIMNFIEDDMLSIFGCLKRIVTNNSKAFESTKMVGVCQNYSIELNHSTTYYP